ncbi:hypothetical protein GGI11_008561, partial [Coemansia sp. RSA 2049]
MALPALSDHNDLALLKDGMLEIPRLEERTFAEAEAVAVAEAEAEAEDGGGGIGMAETAETGFDEFFLDLEKRPVGIAKRPAPKLLRRGASAEISGLLSGDMRDTPPEASCVV